MLTEYLEILRGSLAPPQGWDTNTVRWGENLRKENSKGWRWVENSGDRMPRFEGFEGFILGSKRRWVTPLIFLFWNWCTLLPNYDFEHLLLFLCGLSSIKILESLLPYVLCTQDMNQRNPAVSVPYSFFRLCFFSHWQDTRNLRNFSAITYMGKFSTEN